MSDKRDYDAKDSAHTANLIAFVQHFDHTLSPTERQATIHKIADRLGLTLAEGWR